MRHPPTRLTEAERAEIRRYRRRGFARPDQDIHAEGAFLYVADRDDHRDIGALPDCTGCEVCRTPLGPEYRP